MSITFQGNPLTLAGAPINSGDQWPDFVVANNDLSPYRSHEGTGIRVFLAVPSVDTPVCDLEVRQFNQKVSELPGVSILAVSMDLPFAQARWCAAAGVSAVTMLSDYKDRLFGNATGTLINELGLLTRAVFVVDASNTVRYVEYVPEVTNAPDYEAVYKSIQNLL